MKLAYNEEAEKSVIGSILLSSDVLPDVLAHISESDFYIEKYRKIFSAIVKLNKNDEKIDVLTVGNLLEERGVVDQIGGYAELASCMTAVPSSVNAGAYAKIVADDSRSRKVAELGGRMLEESGKIGADAKKIAQDAAKAIEALSYTKEEEETSTGAILAKFNALQEEYSEAYKAGKRILGISTGFPELDNMTDGIREPHLWIIAGYSSVGKTYFSLNVLLSAIKQGKRCVYYSLEMSSVDIITRLIAILSEMPPQYILKGLATEKERRIIEASKKFIGEADLKIHSTLHTLSGIKHSMLKDHREKPVDCFFLDYVQLVSQTGKEYDDMRLAATEFQALIKKMKVPMFMLSQISNEAAKRPDAIVMGFKGAGNLAHAADVGVEMVPGTRDMELYKKNLGDGVPVPIKFQVKKSRNGRAGNIPMMFSSYVGKFREALYGENDSIVEEEIIRSPYKE